MFGLSKTSFESGNKEFFTLLEASNKPTDPSNPKSSLTHFQVSKYTKDNLQQIFKMVLEAKTSTYSQDWGTSEDSPDWALQPQALDIYKNKSYIDYYNFI